MPFARPTLPELISRVQADVEGRLGSGPLLKRGVLWVLSRVLAGLAHAQHGHVEWAVRQLFPTLAEAFYLEQWSKTWGISRKVAQKAEGSVTFTGTAGAAIPLGTKLRRADGFEYSVTEGGAVEGGGTVTLPVKASTAAAAGDASATTQLSLLSPVASIQTTAVVAAGGLVGGADLEDDEDLRARLLQKIRQRPHGGAVGDYVQWALEVPEVTRAWCLPEWTGAGTVGVTFTLDDDPVSIVPDSTKLDEVEAYLENLRPVTADVVVFAPTLVPLDLTITLTPNTAAAKAAVEDSLRDLIFREASPGGTLRISHIREAISTAPGEKDHVLTTPTADVVSDPGELTTLGTITWS